MMRDSEHLLRTTLLSDSLNSTSPESKTPQLKRVSLNAIVNEIRDRPWLVWLGLIIVFSFILDMYTLTQYPMRKVIPLSNLSFDTLEYW